MADKDHLKLLSSVCLCMYLLDNNTPRTGRSAGWTVYWVPPRWRGGGSAARGAAGGVHGALRTVPVAICWRGREAATCTKAGLA